MTDSWRDIADQLTEEQIAELAECDRIRAPADVMLDAARQYAVDNCYRAVYGC